jgi:hypothetical protein
VVAGAKRLRRRLRGRRRAAAGAHRRIWAPAIGGPRRLGALSSPAPRGSPRRRPWPSGHRTRQTGPPRARLRAAAVARARESGRPWVNCRLLAGRRPLLQRRVCTVRGRRLAPEAGARVQAPGRSRCCATALTLPCTGLCANAVGGPGSGAPAAAAVCMHRHRQHLHPGSVTAPHDDVARPSPWPRNSAAVPAMRSAAHPWPERSASAAQGAGAAAAPQRSAHRGAP